MCAWSIGRLGANAGPKAVKPLIELIKDNYWKVKTSACIAIGCLGQQGATQALPLLLKVLIP
jgi:HEAT repeat protein